MNRHSPEVERLIRIETRVARIQEHFGMPTNMSAEDIYRVEHASWQPTNKRLARIETRIFKLMEALNLNPRTGKVHDNG